MKRLVRRSFATLASIRCNGVTTRGEATSRPQRTPRRRPEKINEKGDKLQEKADEAYAKFEEKIDEENARYDEKRWEILSREQGG